MAVRELQVVMANPELLAKVAEMARRADVDELWATAMMTPAEALAVGLKLSTTFVALADGAPLCAFGITPVSILSGSGCPWMVSTYALDNCAADFIRHCKHDLQSFFGEWQLLYNLVDARNVRAIRWLKWLGFKVLPPIPYGPFKLPFHPFVMEVHHV